MKMLRCPNNVFILSLTGLIIIEGGSSRLLRSKDHSHRYAFSGHRSDFQSSSSERFWSYNSGFENRLRHRGPISNPNPRGTLISPVDNHEDHGDSHELRGSGHEISPYFQDKNNVTNITAQLGSTAYLNCEVNRLGDKTVSWVRRDTDSIKLLTWGLQTYSNDARYSLNFEHPNNWKLQIKYVVKRDAGSYECQISTHPPKVLYFNLNIVAPVVEIIDERGTNVQEKFYKTGSTIELRCTISQMPQAQTFILWRHGEHMLNYDTSRGGISVKTDMSSPVIVSTLYIANATPRDSGNYTCALGDVATGAVVVHILDAGEQQAAMQHGSGTTDLCNWVLVITTTIMCIIINCNIPFNNR